MTCALLPVPTPEPFVRFRVMKPAFVTSDLAFDIHTEKLFSPPSLTIEGHDVVFCCCEESELEYSS